ncbi:outer membrane protein assembly factor [Kordiimonas sediminis]|uniref:Outer membrane protein assembly factor n=1 Tax=Kordiimonas sediminis TaxID=1735581 RepID=A0A919EBF1_9PROT|nr:autotransporter assembly complex family protein [Kordiimonas sediminis]GHF31298.1 outer membrane protein assembly factor [Kordiimonas sediminis]
MQRIAYLTFFIVTAFIESAAGTVLANDCTSGWRLGYSLDIRDLPENTVSLLQSTSSLQERNGNCFRSLSRLSSLIDQDKERLERVLRSEGYYSALMDSRIQRGTRRVDVTLLISAGPVFTIGDINLITDGSIAPSLQSKLQQLLSATLSGNSPVQALKIIGAEQALITLLHENGYPYADALERDVIIDHASRSASVNFKLRTGPIVLAGQVNFQGLVRTQEQYLQRLVPWQKGDILFRSHLITFQRRLQDTGLFSLTTVDLGPEPSAGQPSSIIVTVEEVPHRRIEVGAGYSTGEGFETEFGWQNKNLNGRGQILSAYAKVGESEQSLEGNWTLPHFRKYDQTLLLDGKIGREVRPAYEARFAETYIGLERKFNKRIKASLGAATKTTVNQQETLEDTFFLAGLPLGFAYDSSDNLFDPSMGTRLTLRVQPTMSVIDDRYFFLINELKATHYWKPADDSWLTVAARARLGNIVGPNLDRLPISERFFAGGGGSVRGFSYQRLGDISDSGTPLGGRSVAEVALEARTRVSERFGLVGFVDAGNVYAEQYPKFSNIRWGVGVGVRYFTDFAPIRLDIATPLNRRDGENKIALYISIGQSF